MPEPVCTCSVSTVTTTCPCHGTIAAAKPMGLLAESSTYDWDITDEIALEALVSACCNIISRRSFMPGRVPTIGDQHISERPGMVGPIRMAVCLLKIGANAFVVEMLISEIRHTHKSDFFIPLVEKQVLDALLYGLTY